MRSLTLPAASLLVVGAIAGACRAPRDDRPVETTAGKDSSVAPSAAAAARHDQAQVRVVNAIPGPAAVDVKAGDSTSFQAVPFKAVTPYQQLGDNRPKFTVTPAGEPAAKPLAENSELVMDGSYYTVVAVGDQAGRAVELEAVRDDLTPSDPSKARIRVVNAAARLKDLQIRQESKTEPLFDHVAFKDNVGFKDVDPGKATIVITSADSPRVLLKVSDLDLKAGQSVTLVLTHPSATSTKLEAIKVIDELRPAAGGSD